MGDVFLDPTDRQTKPDSIFGDRLKPLNVTELGRVRAAIIRCKQAQATGDEALAMRFATIACDVIRDVEAQIESGTRRPAAQPVIYRPAMDRDAPDAAHPEAYEWVDDVLGQHEEKRDAS